VEWIWRKVDILIAAVFVAVAAIGASQSHAYMVQYQERLSRDLSIARDRLQDIKTGLRYKLMSDVVRTELEANAQARFEQLDGAHSSIAGANVITKPFALLRHQDPALMADTGKTFVPRLPRSSGGIVYSALGVVLGFALYEALKFPVLFLARDSRRRKFRRRP